MAVVNLTPAEINIGLTNVGVFLGAAQFTYSIPNGASTWPDYAAGTQPFTTYSVLLPAQITAFKAALAQWDTLIAPNFTEVIETGGTPGEIRAAFTSFAMVPADTAAYAFTPTNQVPTSQVGDIWINANTATADFSAGTDNYVTLLHELGHTLGLKHPFEPPAGVIPAPYENQRYSVMSYTPVADRRILGFEVPGGGGIGTTEAYITLASPLVLDIAAVQSLPGYGPDLTTAAGDNTYAFSQNNQTIQAIYDAGGTDTFDLSGITRNSIVDLRPGGYSSIGFWSIADQIAFWQAQPAFANPVFQAFIVDQFNNPPPPNPGDPPIQHYTWTDNVGIAFSTTIENVTGGSGSETITGNDVANFMDLSLGGNDVVSGLVGNDSFFFGAAFTAADQVDGGVGTNDQIGLRGVYTGGAALTLGAASITGVEVVALMPGIGVPLMGYDLTTVDANVAVGVEQIIFAGNLRAGENFTFNGSAETDGRFRVYGGNGTDLVATGNGDDGIYFGPNKFNPATDRIVGGPGANDQFALDGDYTLTLNSTIMQTVEVLALLRGVTGDLADYNITVDNTLITTGQTFTIWGVPVATALTIAGSGETDGNLSLFGGTEIDTLTTGAGADRIWGGLGGDALNAGLGADIFAYDGALQSTGGAAGSDFDRITGFLAGIDKFDLPGTVTGIDPTVVGGALSAGAGFNGELTAAAASLGVAHAMLFLPTAGGFLGATFLLVDANGLAGYQANADYVMQLLTLPGALATTDFV